jgi:hypothetical protein
MSVIIIETIVFSGTNPYGDFVNGDVLDIYYDFGDTTPTDPISGITVQKNGSPLSSGALVAPGVPISPSPCIFKKYGHDQLCQAGYRMNFSYVDSYNSFPYLRKNPVYDTNACPIITDDDPDPHVDVCDLAFSPDIQLAYPSSDTANDGSITVSATSSHGPIKYRMGSDFDYNDGTGSSSGVFSLLLTGSYRVYSRDSLNCGASILINLPVHTVYGVKYTMNYINLAGHRTKIDILQKGYVGSASDFIGGDNPLVMKSRDEGTLDKFSPVVSTEIKVQLVAQTNGQYREFFTNDPKQFQINIYKDYSGGTSYSLFLSGFVVPQVYQETYVNTPYTVELTASDNLALLQQFAYVQDDGNKFIGTIRIMSLLASVLQKTGLQLNIRSGCNIFADTMTTAASDDPLDQAYVDVETYYLAVNVPTFDFILISLLKPFRATLIQCNGIWNIIRFEELVASYNYREYDYQGTYITHGSVNPIIDLDQASASNRMVWQDQDQNLEIRPGFGKLRVNYHLGLKPNILRNGDFRLKSSWNASAQAFSYDIDLYGFSVVSPSYPIQKTFEIVDVLINDVAMELSAEKTLIAKPLGYVQSDTYQMAMGVNNTLKIGISVKAPSGYVNGLAVDGSGNIVVVSKPLTIHYQKVRMKIYYGNRYLQTDGTWTNIPTDVVFYLDQFDQYVDFNISAQWPDASYTTEKDFYVKVYHSWENDYDFSDSAGLKRKITNSNTGTYSDRLFFNPSTNAYPTTGGSGGGGAIQAGDFWTASADGTIQDIVVLSGTKIKCINSTPGQDSSNWLIGDLQLPIGTKTEMHNSSYGPGILYYELQNTTASESIPSVVRPNDYNASTNPNQWVLVFQSTDFSARPNINFFINKIQVQFLDNGKQPFDTVIRDQQGEINNNIAIEDDLYHGSLSSLTVSVTDTALISNTVDSSIASVVLTNKFLNNKTIFPNLVTFSVSQSILSAKLIYAGYLRDASGNGYLNWIRSGQNELDQLHGLWLKTTMAQYNRSWKKITGTMYSETKFFSFINILRETMDNDIFYKAASMTINDKMNSYNSEFLELMDITIAGGSPTREHSSAWSSAFS